MNNPEKIARLFHSFLRLPFVSDAIPGRIVEEIISNVYGAKVLNTYDYADVVIPGSIGWSVKSTKEKTPLTWKRAKIANKQNLIGASLESLDGAAALGSGIIDFCNQHARDSLIQYDLKELRYARCILFPGKKVKYFERTLCSVDAPDIFNSNDYIWTWSREKAVQKKEQLSAFHGIDKKTGNKVWAWHGNGENQLHFSGEKMWWDDEKNSISLEVPYPDDDESIDFEKFVTYLLSISEKELNIADIKIGGTAFPS